MLGFKYKTKVAMCRFMVQNLGKAQRQYFQEKENTQNVFQVQLTKHRKVIVKNYPIFHYLYV